jgi:hypothetical protein
MNKISGLWFKYFWSSIIFEIGADLILFIWLPYVAIRRFIMSFVFRNDISLSKHGNGNSSGNILIMKIKWLKDEGHFFKNISKVHDSFFVDLLIF